MVRERRMRFTGVKIERLRVRGVSESGAEGGVGRKLRLRFFENGGCFVCHCGVVWGAEMGRKRVVDVVVVRKCVMDPTGDEVPRYRGRRVMGARGKVCVCTCGYS